MNAPDRKVTFGMFAGALVAVLVWVARITAGVEVPGEVAVAASTIIVFILQFWVKNDSLSA